MAKQRYTAAQVVEALDKHKGMVYLAAEALGCSHVTIYNYANRYKSVQEAIDRNRGHVLDTAELSLYNAILGGEHWAITCIEDHRQGPGLCGAAGIGASGRLDDQSGLGGP